MKVEFSRVSFLVPVNFDPTYQDSFHCLGLIFSISEYERCLLAPIRMESDDDEGFGFCWISFPAFVNSSDFFKQISALGGNIFTTPIEETEDLHSGDSSFGLSLMDGELEANLVLSNFAAAIRTKSGLLNLTITPSGFLRLAPEKSAATAR